MTNRKNTFLTCIIVAILQFCSSASAEQLLFYDDFNDSSLDISVWQNGSWNLGSRTDVSNIVKLNTEQGVSFVSLILDTYHPNFPGEKLWGSELWSLTEYDVNQGVEFSTRVRARDVDSGMICSFFTFKANAQTQDEIDIEILTNQPVDTFLTTTWNNWDTTAAIYNDGITHQGTLVIDSALDYEAWTEYSIRWYPDRVEWYVNGVHVNTHFEVIPDLAMRIHANFWAAGTEWDFSYSNSLIPVNTASENTRYYYDIDYIKVTSLGDGATLLPPTLTYVSDNGTVDLQWETNSDVDYFEVYRAKKPTGKRTIEFILLESTTALELSDQPSRGKWIYQTVAVNTNGDRATSNAIIVQLRNRGKSNKKSK